MKHVDLQKNLVSVNTNQTAEIICRSPQTLRQWSSEGGPIKPIKINGRLAWRVVDLEKLLSGEAV